MWYQGGAVAQPVISMTRPTIRRRPASEAAVGVVRAVGAIRAAIAPETSDAMTLATRYAMSGAVSRMVPSSVSIIGKMSRMTFMAMSQSVL